MRETVEARELIFCLDGLRDTAVVAEVRVERVETLPGILISYFLDLAISVV